MNLLLTGCAGFIGFNFLKSETTFYGNIVKKTGIKVE